jgi:hypothetical protein
MSKIKKFWLFFRSCLSTLFAQTRPKNHDKKTVAVADNNFDFFDPQHHFGDGFFFSLFEKGIEHDKTPVGDRNRRFWQMIQFFKSVRHLDGEIAEAGVLYGLSSFLLCSYEKEINHGFTGETMHLFDSFQGLSMPDDQDKRNDEIENKIIKNVIAGQAKYSGSFLSTTKETLRDFPNVHYYKGWIPDVFSGLGNRKFKFVHLDLDLYAPILASLKFFYPQVVPGGCIVVDDYEHRDWPGVKLAVDEFAKENDCSVIRLITGNAVIFKH